MLRLWRSLTFPQTPRPLITSPHVPVWLCWEGNQSWRVCPYSLAIQVEQGRIRCSVQKALAHFRVGCAPFTTCEVCPQGTQRRR